MITADEIRKLLDAPDVERVECRPDGTVIVEKRRAAPVYVPTVYPCPLPHPEPWTPHVPWLEVTWPSPNVTGGTITIGDAHPLLGASNFSIRPEHAQ